MNEKLLKLSEVSTILNVCTKTLRRWDKTGKLPAVKTIGGHRRYKLSEIETLVNGEKT